MADKPRKARESAQRNSWPDAPMKPERGAKQTPMAMDEALTRLITRASTLISAIDGVTDQFADEISELKVAMSDAQDVLNAPRPELKQRQGLKPRMRPRM